MGADRRIRRAAGTNREIVALLIALAQVFCYAGTREDLHFLSQQCSDAIGAAILGNPHKHRKPPDPVDQGGDLQFATLPNNQISPESSFGHTLNDSTLLRHDRPIIDGTTIRIDLRGNRTVVRPSSFAMPPAEIYSRNSGDCLPFLGAQRRASHHQTITQNIPEKGDTLADRDLLR